MATTRWMQAEKTTRSKKDRKKCDDPHVSIFCSNIYRWQIYKWQISITHNLFTSKEHIEKKKLKSDKTLNRVASTPT